ncbi:mechanosensitive ion channel family protein [Candidatus Woesearchaeota archaeon]|nr:mechanosensitive ion channel family protein [Candidatus Woesearchaeota archaeon]
MAFTDILQTQIGGNNVVQWLLFIGILILAFGSIKLIYFIFEKIFKTLTKKTKSQVDDLIVDALRGPIIFAVILGAIHFGKGVLTLSDAVTGWYLKVFVVLVAINITWLIVRIIDIILANYVQPMTKKSSIPLSDTSYPVLKRLINFLIYVIAIIVILRNLGFEVSSLLAGLGIGGLAFALAAQDILGNMFAGIAIISDKPFKVGDRILVDGQDGFVRKIGLRTTALETFDGTNIIMPNRRLADSVLENISREPTRRTKVVLGVEYSTSTAKLEKAKKLLAEIIKKNKSTTDESLIHFIGFGPSSLDIQVIYWIKDLNNILGARDEVHFAIKKAFEKEKIEFAYPSQTIYVKK